jgi:hypothetical protein
MAITLRADNRVLVNNSKFAYLTQNYQSNVASVEVSNTEPLTVGTPILLGEMGQTDAEVLKVNAITGMDITIGDVDNNPVNTGYSHPESTRMIALPYDLIQFYHTNLTNTIADETPTFSDGDPITGWIALDPSSYYSTFSDTGHSTGFGWFQYKNSTTSETSQPSNPIPYAGFTLNTAQQVFLDFESLLNTNELKLVSTSDKFNWLNEALATVKNKLNLTNTEYTVSTPQTITTVSGTAEYILPADFSDLVEITTASNSPLFYGKSLEFLPVSQVLSTNLASPNQVKYYLRGRYIGFSPTPTETGVEFNYTYRAKATRVTSLSTYIDLPDNAFYSLKDWMLYRAMMKFQNPLASSYYQSFKNAMDTYMMSSVTRSADLDSWSIGNSSNT